MEIKCLARAFKEACNRQPHMWPALLRIWNQWSTRVRLKCFNVFGMIIDDKFGIIVFFAQAQFISALAKRVKARSITVLFQLMSTQDHGKKKSAPLIYNKSKHGLNFQEVYDNHMAKSERGSEKERELGSQGKTMAGGRLFFPERGNSNKQWLMGVWWAIAAHRSQPRGASRQKSFNSYN